MTYIKDSLKISLLNFKALIKWIVVAALVGFIGGVIGSIFHISIDLATELREHNSYVIFLLPLGGLVIAFLYNLCKKQGHIDTNRVLEAIRQDEKVPFVMAPLIFISTVITHLFGGSAGREGAALQLGGSIGYKLGKVLKLNKNDMHIVVMSGMSGVFAALFGTPLTAMFFSLEVTKVGEMYYTGLVPCLVSSYIAYFVALLFKIGPVRFDSIAFETLEFDVILKVAFLAVFCALVSILFCVAIKRSEHYMKRFIKNNYFRALFGGALIVILTLLLGTHDYNGAGMDIIAKAMSGNARYEAFLLKIIFTVITISAGFKGGEIVPTFFIGSTFGCVFGSLLGLDASFAAQIGFVSLFCGVVNCPVASLILALEVFGSDSIFLFAVAVCISYMLSGRYSLYKSQEFVNSKI
ncbi:MAG: chloride channel protein [Ruminococcaceae bacterium]|nr:chloride channel protein [Oscillospiraceae bacterium]